MKRSLSLLLALSIALAPMSVRAEVVTPEIAAARKKFERALELEKAGEFKEALALIREVAAVRATTEVHFHLGICLERLGRLVEARSEYMLSRGEAEVKVGSDGAVMAEKATARIADLDARIPKVAIKVPRELLNAKVSVDNAVPVSLLVSPVVLLDPGTHKLVVSAVGKRAFSRVVVVKERDPVLEVEVELADEESDEPPPEEEAPVVVALPPRPRETDPKSSPYPYVFGGIGLAVLATAGVFYALRDSTVHEMDEACGPSRDRCPRSIEDTESRGRTYTTTANILLGIGAAAVVTGVVFYLAEPKKSARVAVGGGPSTLGATFITAF